MTQDTPTTPETPDGSLDHPAPPVPPKSGVAPNPLPPVETPQADPMPGAQEAGD